MGELSKLINIGKVVEGQLNQAGIETADQLKLIGSKQAWLKIRAFDPSSCLHKLMGLEGAIQGKRKTELSKATKEELREFYQSWKV